MNRRNAITAFLLLPHALHGQVAVAKEGELVMWVAKDRNGVLALHCRTDKKAVKVTLDEILDALDPE